MVITQGFTAELTGGFDQRAKGLARLVTVTSDGETVRIVIQGENPVGMWESIFRGTLPQAEGFKVVSGVLF